MSIYRRKDRVLREHLGAKKTFWVWSECELRYWWVGEGYLQNNFQDAVRGEVRERNRWRLDKCIRRFWIKGQFKTRFWIESCDFACCCWACRIFCSITQSSICSLLVIRERRTWVRSEDIQPQQNSFSSQSSSRPSDSTHNYPKDPFGPLPHSQNRHLLSSISSVFHSLHR